MGKALSSAVKSVGNVASGVVNGVGKIASGKVSEGLGDIGQTTARMGLDIVTVGNKKLVDDLSGGLMTATENAARGNTKDIARLGVTAGAVAVGGPMAGLTANTVFASGGDAIQASLAGAGASGGALGAGASIANKFMNQPSASVPKSTEQPQQQPQTIVIPSQASSGGIDSKTMMMIGGGLMGFILVIVMIQRR